MSLKEPNNMSKLLSKNHTAEGAIAARRIVKPGSADGLAAQASAANYLPTV